MTVSWLLLAPVVAAASALSECVKAWRGWRKGTVDLAELLEEVGVAALYAGLGAAAMLHPALALIVIAGTAGVHARALKKLVSRRPSKVLPKGDEPDDSG